MEASRFTDPYEQELGDPRELDSVMSAADETDNPAAETDGEVVELPVDPDAVLRSVLEYLGFKGEKLEYKIKDLREDPETRRKLLSAYQDEALARQGE